MPNNSPRKTAASARPQAPGQPLQIQLTPEEAALFRPFCQACDARVEGFAQAMEQAKRLLLQQLIAARKPQ
jgi:hypothetical protein